MGSAKGGEAGDISGTQLQRAYSVGIPELQHRHGFTAAGERAPLPDDLGSALAVDVSTHSQAAALLMVKSDIYDEVYSEVMEYGVFTLSKPTSAQLLSQYLKILCTARERIRRLEGKQQSVEEKIEEIRLVNHAKWLLIECLSMSEAEAQRYIEKQAMDLRISKRQMAENVIKTYE